MENKNEFGLVVERHRLGVRFTPTTRTTWTDLLTRVAGPTGVVYEDAGVIWIEQNPTTTLLEN